MKRNMKKGDGLATIVITIVLIVIVLLIVPVLKAFQSSAGSNTKTTALAQTSMINTAANAAQGDAAWTVNGAEVADAVA